MWVSYRHPIATYCKAGKARQFLCSVGEVSAAFSWVSCCALWGHVGWQDEGMLVTLRLSALVTIAVKNAFSSSWFWSFIKLWLVLRTAYLLLAAQCILLHSLLEKLFLCCDWCSLLFGSSLSWDLLPTPQFCC